MAAMITWAKSEMNQASDVIRTANRNIADWIYEWMNEQETSVTSDRSWERFAWNFRNSMPKHERKCHKHEQNWKRKWMTGEEWGFHAGKSWIVFLRRKMKTRKKISNLSTGNCLWQYMVAFMGSKICFMGIWEHVWALEARHCLLTAGEGLWS